MTVSGHLQRSFKKFCTEFISIHHVGIILMCIQSVVIQTSVFPVLGQLLFSVRNSDLTQVKSNNDWQLYIKIEGL